MSLDRFAWQAYPAAPAVDDTTTLTYSLISSIRGHAVTAGLIDIHCHILPGIDDGAPDWQEALAMARMAANDGIRTIVATPHQLGGYADNRPATIRARCTQFQQLLQQQGIPLRVLPGADVRIEPELAALLRKGDVLTLADNGRYVLVELPHETFFPLDTLIRQLVAIGVRAILSHPERNRAILRRPALVPELFAAGCLMQVTAGSLMGSFGPGIRQFAERLVVEGWVHFVATDAHGQRARRPLLRRAMEHIASLTDEATAWRLCSENPSAVVLGRQLTACPQAPRTSPRNQGGWFRWRRAS